MKEAEQYLKRRNVNLFRGTIGERSFLAEKIFDIPKSRSGYYDRIYQGATIVPRQLWLIEIVSHPKLGINFEMPKIRTSERAVRRAKEAYEDLSVEGVIEPRFIFAGLTGSELAPFGYLTPLLMILPIEPTKTQYRLMNSEEAHVRGFLLLEKWLRRCEKEWENRQAEKAGRMTIYQRLDRQRGLSRQNPKTKYKVLYNTSGTFLVSAVLKNEKPSVMLNGRKLELNGIIIDHKLYLYETDNEDEAFYLSAVLNSSIIDDIIKPAQSRGRFGPRDIHKKPFEIAIPSYNPRNPIEKQLSKLGKECTQKVEQVLPALAGRYNSIAWIRRETKEALKHYTDQIDILVLKLFEEYGGRGTLEAFTRQS